VALTVAHEASVARGTRSCGRARGRGGFVERFNRTLKEQVIHGVTYRNRDELAAAVTSFVDTYNREWRLEKLCYKSPNEARRDFQPSKLLAA